MQDWLAGACDRKNWAYYTYIKHSTIENKCKYKKLKKIVDKHVAKAKCEYYTKYFKNMKVTVVNNGLWLNKY